VELLNQSIDDKKNFFSSSGGAVLGSTGLDVVDDLLELCDVANEVLSESSRDLGVGDVDHVLIDVELHVR